MRGVRLAGAMVAVLALITACTPSAGSEGPLDVDFGVGVQPEPGEAPEAALSLPRGSVVHRLEISLRGLCPKCAKAAKPARRA